MATGQIELPELAQLLLRRMQAAPSRLGYDTDVFGSMFRDRDLEDLDAAYRALEVADLIERTGGHVSFFRRPKPLYRLSEKGRNFILAGRG